MKHYNKMARQAGMTLIELTVVLLVLVGLAGLLIPYVGGFVGRTHDSSGADSLAEVAKAIAGYDAKYQGYPGNLDRLIDSTGAATGYLMNNAIVAPVNVNATNTQSLFRAGITSLRGMCDDAADADCTAFNPTFNYNDNTGDWAINMMGAINGVAPAATDFLLTVHPDEAAATAAAIANPGINNVEHICGIQNAAADTDGDGTVDNIYVMLGVGPESDMIGRTIQQAPVHFAQVGAMNANNRYNRFVAIFRVDNDNDVGRNGSADNATLLCTAMAMSDIEGPQASLQRFYDRADQEGS